MKNNILTLVALAAILTTSFPAFAAGSTCPKKAPKAVKTYCQKMSEVEATLRRGQMIDKDTVRAISDLRNKANSANVRSWRNKKALKALEKRLADLEKSVEPITSDEKEVLQNSANGTVGLVAVSRGGKIETPNAADPDLKDTVSGLPAMGGDVSVDDLPKLGVGGCVDIKRITTLGATGPNAHRAKHHDRVKINCPPKKEPQLKLVPSVKVPTTAELEARRKAEAEAAFRRNMALLAQAKGSNGGFWVGCLAGAGILGGAGAFVGYGIGSKEELDGVVISNTEPKAIAISAAVGVVVGCVGGGLMQHYLFTSPAPTVTLAPEVKSEPAGAVTLSPGAYASWDR